MSCKNTCRTFLLGLFLVCLAACGQTVTHSVPSITSDAIHDEGKEQKIVLLPFADYTRGESPDDSLRRQVKLYNALAVRLAEYGIHIPFEEDVVQLLIDKGIIDLGMSSGASGNAYDLLVDEMGSGWSEYMQKEMNKLMLREESRIKSGRRLEFSKVGLDAHMIREIGSHFGADYVLRGRIVEYEMRNENTLNPVQRGILPFFFDFSSKTMFGVASSEMYDLWQTMATAGGIGALLGASAETPFSEAGEKVVTTGGSHPRFASQTVKDTGGYDDHAGLNAAYWGAAAAGAAFLAKHGGKVPEAVVQLSLALQDAKTGAVVWTNRAEFAVAPESMWADSSARTLMDRAVEEAVSVLVEDLALSLNEGLYSTETTQPGKSGLGDT